MHVQPTVVIAKCHPRAAGSLLWPRLAAH